MIDWPQQEVANITHYVLINPLFEKASLFRAALTCAFNFKEMLKFISLESTQV